MKGKYPQKEIKLPEGFAVGGSAPPTPRWSSAPNPVLDSTA